MKLAKFVTVGFVAFAVTGCNKSGTCTVLSHKAEEETFLINGELDYGIVVNAKVKLEGSQRNVNVTSRLETNNGDISKSISISLRDGQIRDVQLQFSEPVLGTTFGNYYTACS